MYGMQPRKVQFWAVGCRILSGTCRMVYGGTVGYRWRAIFDLLKLLELWQSEQTLNKPPSCRRIRPAAVTLSGQSKRHRNSTRRGEPVESASSCAASVCCESRTCCMPLSTFCTTGCPQSIHNWSGRRLGTRHVEGCTVCNLKQRGETVGKRLLCKAITQGLRVGVLSRPDIERRRTSGSFFGRARGKGGLTAIRSAGFR